jgi:hypothetical protein
MQKHSKLRWYQGKERRCDLLVAVLVNDVVHVRVVVHLVVVVDHTVHAHVLRRPVDLELLTQPAVVHARVNDGAQTLINPDPTAGTGLLETGGFSGKFTRLGRAEDTLNRLFRLAPSPGPCCDHRARQIFCSAP